MKKGFTLIELLIVLVIILMMILVAVPQFSKYGKRSALSMKAEEFRLVVDNAYKYSFSPEIDFNGAAVTFNYDPPVSTIANKAHFYVTEEPWRDLDTEAWLEVSVPNDMKIENLINAEPRATAYFVSPGKYLKDPALTAIGFRLSYIDTSIADYVDVNLFPVSTLSPIIATKSPRFEVVIDESWN